MEDDESYFPRLVSHISGRLRDIALGNPTFWSTIDFIGGKTSYDDIAARLDRSRDAPLDVTVTRLDTREDAEKMLELLYPHVGRWRSFTVEVWEAAAADAVMSALVDAAPRLETLSLSGFSNGPVNPFGGNTPALKSLTVRGVSIVWDTPLFYNLTSLYVHSSNWTNPALLEKCESLP